MSEPTTDAERFRLALALIQEAQNTVNAACRALCSARERGDRETAYSIACKLSRQIKADWHRIEKHRSACQSSNSDGQWGVTSRGG